MPKAEHHLKKAQHNKQFLHSIPVVDYPDWKVVAAFYTAVHLVERLRAKCQHGDSLGHEDRLEYIRAHHQSIHTHYHILQNVSMLARYQSMGDFYHQFQPHEIEQRLLIERLYPIEQYIEQYLQPVSGS
jgi:hypothetical protein